MKNYLFLLLLAPLMAFAHGDSTDEEPHDDSALPTLVQPGTEQYEMVPSVAAPKVPGMSQQMAAGGDEHEEIEDSRGEMSEDSHSNDDEETHSQAVAASVDSVDGDDLPEADGEFVEQMIEYYEEIPTLHPMIVHFPVVLIPMALLLFVAGMVGGSRTVKSVSVFLLAVGTGTGFLAAFPFHPHTTGLTPAAAATLVNHDFYAYTTLIVGSAGTLIGLFVVWLNSFRVFFQIIFFALLLLASASVIMTGHYGGKITHFHGVGPQGKFLESGH